MTRYRTVISLLALGVAAGVSAEEPSLPILGRRVVMPAAESPRASTAVPAPRHGPVKGSDLLLGKPLASDTEPGPVLSTEASLVPGAGFDAISQATSGVDTPDVNLAVGPGVASSPGGYLVETVNRGLRIFRKDGTAASAYLHFEPAGSQCVHCLGSNDPESCFEAQGWSLTFGALRAFCDDDPGCTDAAGNVTVCVEGANACEVHVFESDWINHELFEDRPICAPVASQVCIDGAPKLSSPHAFEEHHEGGLACGDPQVCITFHRECLCRAVGAWEAALGSIVDSFDGKWLYHVGFTTCESCDCLGISPPQESRAPTGGRRGHGAAPARLGAFDR